MSFNHLDAQEITDLLLRPWINSLSRANFYWSYLGDTEVELFTIMVGLNCFGWALSTTDTNELYLDEVISVDADEATSVSWACFAISTLLKDECWHRCKCFIGEIV